MRQSRKWEQPATVDVGSPTPEKNAPISLPSEPVGDRVDGHDGEVLPEGPQGVVVRLGDPVGAVEYAEREEET